MHTLYNVELQKKFERGNRGLFKTIILELV
jgi:hypothetical protein